MTHLNPTGISLLKPVIARSDIDTERLYTLKPLQTHLKASSKNVQFYSFDTYEEESFRSIERIEGTISAMSPLECFQELCTRFPAANPGCRRVFLVGYPGFIANGKGQYHYDEDLSKHRVGITTWGMPNATHVVVYPDDIYDGSDINEFRDLVVKCGSLATINEDILRYNEDTNFMWSKGVYSPGNLKMALYDHDGRIAKRRNTLKTRKHGITLELYSNHKDLFNHTEGVRKLLEDELTRIRKIRTRRIDQAACHLDEVVFQRFEPHPSLAPFFLHQGVGHYGSTNKMLPRTSNIKVNLLVDRHFFVDKHLGNLDVFSSLYNGALINLMRRAKTWTQFRHHLLVALLHLTEPLATIRYLSSEVASPGHQGLTNVMDACFAVARLIRILSPTRQEILNVRSQHAEPDLVLLDAACDHLRRTGKL